MYTGNLIRDCYSRIKNLPSPCICQNGMLPVILDEEIKNEELRTHIYDQVTPEELAVAITECKSLIRPHADDYFDFFALRYSYLRQFVRTFLAAFNFSSNRQPDALIEAITLLRNLDAQGKRKVPENTSVVFVPSRWSEYVIIASTVTININI